MFSYRPKSFLQLVLIGFVLIAAPLVVAVINATVYVSRLAAQSEHAVSYAIEVTQWSRMLSEHLLAMERSARQYQVLGDASLLLTYTATRKTYQQIMDKMLGLPQDIHLQDQLKSLMEKEIEVFDVVQNNPYNSAQSSKAIREFATLADLAGAIVLTSDRLIDRETRRAP